MTIAVFDYAAWSALFPSLAAGVDSTLATALFGQAGLYVDNTDSSVVQDVGQRLAILNLVTAHLAAMTPEGGGSGTVGRLGKASEGSVSASFEYKSTTDSAWWDQTPYGAQAWLALAPYRLGAYVPAPVAPIGYYPGRGFRLGYSTWPG